MQGRWVLNVGKVGASVGKVGASAGKVGVKYREGRASVVKVGGGGGG